ncbi:MAG: thioredoxin family protein [Gaiellaceae bacterium]
MSIALGTEMPSFELPGVDGNDHAAGEYGDAKLLALVQYCNHCPYVLAWEGRLIGIASDYADLGLRVVAINSNDVDRYPEDSFERMRQRAEELDFPFDYLFDASQSLARTLGAERTPEIFLFDEERRLRYHGAIDDSRDEDGVEKSYLREAIDALLAGQEPPVAETGSVGCTVKWKQ